MASTFKSHANDDGSVMIRGMASTSHSDRAGDVIAAEAWTKGGLDNFKNNPVILFNHDYDKPIGRATGVNVTENGLELEAKISKSAPASVCELVKDGVLGAFSVGFKVKDADYIKETDGLMIKDAELFEVSVVSVPCNQAATFSLAKSFDSIEEYNEFKKTFTNRVDLAGQSLAKDDSKESKVASDTPQSVEKSTTQEIKMENKDSSIDLEAFAKKVADETAAKIAMKQAEEKAAKEAEAKAAQEAAEAKALEAETIKSSIQSGIQTGVEKLQADIEADFAKDSENKIAEITAKYEKELKERADELEAMRKSKRDFSGRQKGDISAWGKEFLGAHILGKITGKGWNTKLGQELSEKAGVDFTATSAAGIDVTVSNQFEEEVRLATPVAALFREIPVSSGSTVLPVNPNSNEAYWGTAGPAADAGYLEDVRDGTQADDDGFHIDEILLRAYRLVSGTYVAADTDEQALISVLPMIQNALVSAHAKAIDKMILLGNGTITGLLSANGTDQGNAGHAHDITNAEVADGTNNLDISDLDLLTAANINKSRRQMGKYGMNPADLAVIMGTTQYYDLLNDAEFGDVQEVGAMSTKVNGSLGTVYGMDIVVSEHIGSATAGKSAFTIVNKNNFVIPRLAGVNIESDYSVANQRTDIVASQSLGFNAISAGAAAPHGHPAVVALYQA